MKKISIIIMALQSISYVCSGATVTVVNNSSYSVCLIQTKPAPGRQIVYVDKNITMPVTLADNTAGYNFRYAMPPNYTIDTAPSPSDKAAQDLNGKIWTINNTTAALTTTKNK